MVGQATRGRKVRANRYLPEQYPIDGSVHQARSGSSKKQSKKPTSGLRNRSKVKAMMRSVVDQEPQNSLLEYSRRPSLGVAKPMKSSVLSVQIYDDNHEKNGAMNYGSKSLFYKPETNKNYPQIIPTKLPTKLSAQMKKDVKNLNTLKNDKSLRILLDSIEDYPQRLKAFRKYVRSAQDFQDRPMSVSRGRIASGGRSSISPGGRGRYDRSDLILYLDSVTFADDSKFNCFLTMLKDDVWKYEKSKGVRSRSRSASPHKKQMLVKNSVREIRVENCNVKASKLLAIFEAFNGSMSLEKIWIKGLRYPLKDTIISSITQLIQSLPKQVARSQSRGAGRHLYATMASTIEILDQISPNSRRVQRQQQQRKRQIHLRIEDTVVLKESQQFLLEQLVKIKDPATLSLINVDLDLSENVQNQVEVLPDNTKGQKDNLPIVQLLALKRFMNLRNLNLSKNQIGLPSILALSKGLIHNQPLEDWKNSNSLRSLNLSHNKLGPQATKLICESLLDHSGLRTLNLSHNFIGNEGAICLASLLAAQSKMSAQIANKTGKLDLVFGLRHLNVSSNKIGDEGMEVLVKTLTPKVAIGAKRSKKAQQMQNQSASHSLKSRQNLQVLRAQNNRSKIVIGNLTLYLKLIGLNETLIELRLGGATSDLDENAMKQIAFAIKNNYVLQKLDLGNLGETNFLLLQQMILSQKSGNKKRPPLTILKPYANFSKAQTNFDMQITKVTSAQKQQQVKQRLKRERELQAYLLSLDDKSKAYLQDRFFQSANASPELLGMFDLQFQRSIQSQQPRKKRSQSGRKSLRGPRGSSSLKYQKDKPVINISTVTDEDKQNKKKERQQEPMQHIISGEVNYQDRTEMGGNGGFETIEEKDQEVIQEQPREQMDLEMDNDQSNDDQREEQSDMIVQQQSYKKQKSSKENSNIGDGDDTVDFDLSKTRSRIDSKSKARTPAKLGTTNNRSRLGNDSGIAGGGVNDSNPYSYSVKENNQSANMTNKTSPQKSSKMSANQDILGEEEENRLMQMKQMPMQSPGGQVAEPEHPDKIFDYEQIDPNSKQMESSSSQKHSQKPPKSGKDEQSQRMQTERQALSIVSKDQPISSNKVGSKSSPSALSSIAPNQTQDPFLPGIGSTSNRIKTALSRQQDSNQRVPTDFRDHEQQPNMEDKQSKIAGEIIKIQEASYKENQEDEQEDQKSDNFEDEMDEIEQMDDPVTSQDNTFQRYQGPQEPSQIFEDKARKRDERIEQLKNEKIKIDMKLIKEYYDTSSERQKEMSGSDDDSGEGEDDEQESYYYETTQRQSRVDIVKKDGPSAISRYHDTSGSRGSKSSSAERGVRTSYDRRKYDKKLREIRDLKTQLLENQLQEKLRVLQMGSKFQNTHSLRRKHYGKSYEQSQSSKIDDQSDNFYFLTKTNHGTESKYKNESKSIEFDYVISSSSRTNNGYQAEEDSVERQGQKFLERQDSSEEERSDLGEDDSYDDEDDDRIGNLQNSHNQFDQMKQMYRQLKESDKASSSFNDRTPDSRMAEVRQKYQMLDYSKHRPNYGRNLQREDNLQGSADSFQRNYRTQLRQRMRDNDSNGSSIQFGDIFGVNLKDSASSNMHDSQPRSKMSKY